MNEIQVSENITLITNGFGDFNTDVVIDLLKHVDIWLSEALRQQPFTSKKVEIRHFRTFYPNSKPEDEEPECRNSDDKTFHIILLATSGLHWCQLVLQFAHEYCHHLIDEPLKGKELHGLKWFEETICELSSIYCLERMKQYCQKQEGHISVEEYIKKREEEADKTDKSISSYIKDNIEILSSISSKGKIEDEDRNRHKLIAFSILDLFTECSALWQIILHFGNTCEWKDLSELFKHLEKTADNAYIEPLNELKIRLLGS